MDSMVEVERNRVEKKKHASGSELQIEADAESHQIKRSRFNKKKNDVSGVENGVDSSHEQLGGDSESVNKKNSFSGLETEDKRVAFLQSRRLAKIGVHKFNPTISSRGHGYAEIALKFYEKEKETDEHELIKVLFANRKSVVVPGYGGIREWCHVRFIAKPKNTDRSPENFFAEIMLDHTSGIHNVMNCLTFKPSGAGLTYGCGFCSESPSYLHPADDYLAGLPDSTYPIKLSDEYLAALELYDFDRFYF